MSAVQMLLFLGIAMCVGAFRWKRKLEKYEFENRTDGGVVQFGSFEKSKAHERAWGMVDLLNRFGIVAIIVSVIMLVLTN